VPFGVDTVTHGRLDEELVLQFEPDAATPIRTVPPEGPIMELAVDGVRFHVHEPGFTSAIRAMNASERASTAGWDGMIGAVIGRSGELLVPAITTSPPDISAAPNAASAPLPPKYVE
jgi:hypothetical protein